MAYSKITKEEFNQIQFDAGILVKQFNPAEPEINNRDIICVTSGGISLTVEPHYEDLSEDVYMMPPGEESMKILTGIDVVISFVSLTMNKDTIKLSLGCADCGDAIQPRLNIHQDDYQDLWWIGDKCDGGFVAVKVKNVLSNEGLSIQTSKNKSGQLSISLLAHPSLFDDDWTNLVEIYSEDFMPFFYVQDHIYLCVKNPWNDEFILDEENGTLTIIENSDWHYSINYETGMAEVTR